MRLLWCHQMSAQLFKVLQQLDVHVSEVGIGTGLLQVTYCAFSIIFLRKSTCGDLELNLNDLLQKKCYDCRLCHVDCS